MRVDAQHGIDKAARQIALALARSVPQATDSSIQNVVAELERSLADSERILGADHPSTLTVRANLAGLYQQTGRSEAAVTMLQQSLADGERILGPKHPTILAVRANLEYVLSKGLSKAAKDD